MEHKPKINSIEQDQDLGQKIKTLMSQKPINRFISYLFLSREEKMLYKNLRSRQLNSITNKKTSYNAKNVFEIENYNFWYDHQMKHGLIDLNLKLKRNIVTALIGPSGCGKSTFIRCLNRMNDQIDGTCSTGNIYFDIGINIKSKNLNILELNTRVGMIFQKPTPFPMSIYDNVAYGLRSHGINNKKILDKLIKEALIDAALWEEVKNNLYDLGTSLSGGQQQRLCIARAIALKPEVLLMDEPTSGLDPIATSKIELLIAKLKEKFTIIIVTHSMEQAQRVSDETVFFYLGRIYEYGQTRRMFMSPKEKKTREYVSGKIG